MKVLSFALLCLMATTMVFVTGCGEEESPDPIIGTWQKSKVEQSTDGGTWAASSATCELDDTEEYGKDGRWTLYTGPNQCSAGAGLTKGTWRLAANRTKIVFTYDAFQGEYESTIERLSGNDLVIIHAVGDLANTQFKTTYIRK